MSRYLLALLALAALAAADSPRPRLLDFNPWSWLPANRNRSPSIMDYFFPPSRTPKQSMLDPPSDRAPPKTTIAATDTTPEPSTIEDRTTVEERATVARKASTKTKLTTASHATASPKKKSTPRPTPAETTVETKIIQTIKAETPTPTVAKITTTTSRPTKHYSIRPVVRTTTASAIGTESTLNTEADSTESVPAEEAGTTAADGGEAPAPTGGSAGADAASTPADATAEPASTPADAPDSREGYLPLRDKPQQTHVKINEQTKKETVPLPAGSTSVLAKPTKYHYYPHNQHIYLLPECAIQQVCNAVYVRLNYTQPLCACPARYRDPCSASLNADDLHTTRLTTDSKKKYANKAVTLVKTCEAVSEMRECRAPRDWSLLALQNIRTGKSHYLVICRCPESHILEGPMSHDQPTYASVPGIRVYGMMCVRPTTNYGYNANRYTAAAPGVQSTTSAYKVDYSQPHSYGDKPVYNRYNSYPEHNYYNRRSRVARFRRSTSDYPPFPWYKVIELARSLHWIN